MTTQMWIPIFGNAHIDGGTITSVPVSIQAAGDDMPAADGGAAQAPHTVVRSNIEFEQGTITWEAKISEESGRVQLMLPAEPSAANSPDASKGELLNSELSVGLNVLGAPYGFALWNGGGWEGAGGAGHGSPDGTSLGTSPSRFQSTKGEEFRLRPFSSGSTGSAETK